MKRKEILINLASILLLSLGVMLWTFGILENNKICNDLGFDGTYGGDKCYNNIYYDDGTYGFDVSEGHVKGMKENLLTKVLGMVLIGTALVYNICRLFDNYWIKKNEKIKKK